MDGNLNLICSMCKSKLTSEVYMLKCMHNLCVSCIESIQDNTIIICALCKTTTNKDGVVRNNFIEKMIQYQNLNNEDYIKNINCEICLPEIITAEKYCIDCEQYFCVKCATSHVKNKPCIKHSIVEKDKINKEIFKSKEFKCEKHKQDLTMYCKACDSLICATCCVLNHTGHQKEDDLNEIFESSKPIITNKVCEINNLIQSQYLEQETNKNIKLNFMAKVNSIKIEIDEQAKQLKDSIDDMREKLMNSLIELEKKYIKIIDKNYEEISEYISELNNFKTYLECVVENGSNFEILKVKNEMEQSNWIENIRPCNLSKLNLTYKKSTFDDNVLNCKNLFGQFQEDSLIFKLRNKVSSSCNINDSLYAMDRKNKCIDIYHINSLTFQSSIDCKKYIQPHYGHIFIIGVSNNLFLYCDYKENKNLKTIIYKHNTLEFVEWKTMERCRLSSTNRGTILAITYNYKYEITEFSIDGQKLNKFKVPDNAMKRTISYWCYTAAHQLNNGRYVVASFDFNSVLISLLNGQGKFIKSFTKNRTDYICLCTDGVNNIFVLDNNIGLITVLSTDLKQIDEFTIPNASYISYDKQNDKMIVMTEKYIEYINYKF